MSVTNRPRRLIALALTAVLPALVAGCTEYPNSVFTNFTEFNREIGSLFSLLIWLGTAVFVFVTALLLYALYRFRARPGDRLPEQVHGNTTLEILWTVIPAIVLVVIAVPTVRAIFNTQAAAPAGSLEVEVMGHQWWWEFRYPEYNIVTANELYLPTGRTVNFTLRTKDVIHSFWIPQLGGKRDLINNRTNYLWFTPDSSGTQVWNGFCVEYCGASHANMRFRAFTVTPEEFGQWVAHMQSDAVFSAPAAPAAGTTPAPGATAGAPVAAATPGDTAAAPGAQIPAGQTAPAAPAAPPALGVTTPGATTPATMASAPAGQRYTGWPIDQVPAYAQAHTPVPRGLTFDEAVLARGDAARGAQMFGRGQGACIGCHAIQGVRGAVSPIGPNLTHYGSRTTLGAGLFPNDAMHLALWIKNARAMKPGIIMPTLGLGQYDPILKREMSAGGLTDEQIADLVAYLLSLK
jgi:cytochrome c oxidase subunit II